MVHIVNAGNAAHYEIEKAPAHKLRHQVFVEERRWEALRRPDGHDIDQFDTDEAIHILAIEDGAVVGYSRLLPTVGPHLLSAVYPGLAERPIPRAPNIFEWTRYCVSPRITRAAIERCSRVLRVRQSDFKSRGSPRPAIPMPIAA